jgi:peptide deformylase
MKIITDIDILRQKSKDVGVGSIPRLNITLVRNLKNTLKRYGGLGLGAIQIGTPLRAFIITNNAGKIITCYNPVIREVYDEIIFPDEGCLSLPNIRVNTKRYKYCEVEYYDEHKQFKRMVMQDLEAVEFLHEVDHLEGMLIIDRQVKSKPIVRVTSKIGRNDKCPCGSGKKYKKCCLLKQEAEHFNI